MLAGSIHAALCSENNTGTSYSEPSLFLPSRTVEIFAFVSSSILMGRILKTTVVALGLQMHTISVSLCRWIAVIK